jgi:bifunctional enzyme CysN/CysC
MNSLPTLGDHADKTKNSSAIARDVVRIVTCGSVDDGKSTLIGRLLYECNAIPDDELALLEKDSVRFGATPGIDFALLVDGLQVEREQGITVDVSYRYFSTPRRTFILADTPGHIQYTRNMVTGASTSDLAIVLIDASKGLSPQTRRHSIIVHQLGVRHIVVAINKMDLVDFSKGIFQEIESAYSTFAEKAQIQAVTFIPLVARDGDNVNMTSSRLSWYTGPTLLHLLETVEVTRQVEHEAVRMTVQWVNRTNSEFRGYSGTVASGSLRAGEDVVVLPSGQVTRISRIVTYDGDASVAGPGTVPTVVLADEIDLSRGDVISALKDRPEVADQFNATVIWMSEEKMLPHRPYWIRCGNQWSLGEVSAIKHKISMENLEHLTATSLDLNDFAICNISCRRPLIFEPYIRNRRLGSFILVDQITKKTVACGLIRFALRRARNIHWQAIEISKKQRAGQKNQKPFCIWFTGLSGSGKSTIANQLEKILFSKGYHTYILDGDNIRHGLCRDLGFTEADRIENIRRVAHAARLMVDAGLIVLSAFISPFEADRRAARELFLPGEFIEVFVDTPLAICEQRDAKGLYQKAREGLIPNFTGVSSPYERPQNPEILLSGEGNDLDALIEKLVSELERIGLR